MHFIFHDLILTSVLHVTSYSARRPKSSLFARNLQYFSQFQWIFIKPTPALYFQSCFLAVSQFWYGFENPLRNFVPFKKIRIWTNFPCFGFSTKIVVFLLISFGFWIFYLRSNYFLSILCILLYFQSSIFSQSYHFRDIFSFVKISIQRQNSCAHA